MIENIPTRDADLHHRRVETSSSEGPKSDPRRDPDLPQSPSARGLNKQRHFTNSRFAIAGASTRAQHTSDVAI